MSDEVRPTPPPGEIFIRAERAVDFVRRALKLELDYKPETLPLLDHYLGQVPTDKPEVLELVAVAAGAYFGEVVRKLIAPSEWDGDDLVLLGGGLRFDPAGMAAEAISHDDSEGRGAYDVGHDVKDAVEAALEAKGEVDQAEFYSLSGRLETILLIADAIAGVRSSAPKPPDDDSDADA